MSRLREHKKERTARAIQLCAVSLARAHGMEHVTTEMIAEAAGISPRTFFNYFPYKEAAFLPPKFDIQDAACTRFAEGAGGLFDDLVGLITELIADHAPDPQLLVDMHEILGAEPRLMALQHLSLHEFEAELARLFSRRLPGGPESEPAVFTASLVMIALKESFKAWSRGGGDVGEIFRDKFRHLVDCAAQLGR